MKKLITLSLIALFAIGNLMALELTHTGHARVKAGAILNNGWDSDASTKTWKNQRIRIVTEGVAENGVKFVIRSLWSNGDVGGSNFKKSMNTGVSIDRAYIVIPDAVAGFTVQAGKLPFYLKNGLIVDDNQPGIFASGSFGDVSVGFGGFTMSEDNDVAFYTADADGDENTNNYQNAASASDDVHAIVASVSVNNVGPGTLGLDVAAQTNYKLPNDATHKAGDRFWISPWYSLGINDFSVTVNPILLTGCHDAVTGSGAKKVEGSVMAVSVKPSYNLSTGTSIYGDVLYISGTDKPAEELAWSNLSSFYCSGLEWFGAANPTDNYGDLGNVVGNEGQMGVAAFVDQPLGKAFTLHFGVGHIMTAEDVKYTKDGKEEKDNVLGTEINACLFWNVKENVVWKFNSAYVMPGDATTKGGKDDAITSLTTYLQYSF